MYGTKEKGSALVMTLFFAIIFAGLVSFLLLRVRTDAQYQYFRHNRIKGLNITLGGLNIAMVKIGASPYTAGPSGDRNAALYNADSTEDGQPGSCIVDNGIYRIQVNNLGDLWYEIISTSIVRERKYQRGQEK